MKFRFIFFGVVGSLLILNSCAFHEGMMTGNASLSGDDFEIISIEFGTAKTTHVFGIGGLNHQALVFEAKRNMYRSAPLKKGQAFANVSVDFKRSYFPIVGTTIVTVTADLVQFGSKRDTTLQEGFLGVSNVGDLIDGYTNPGFFEPNQIVYLFKKKDFVPVRIVNGFENKNGKYKISLMPPLAGEKLISGSDLFLLEEPTSFQHQYHIGDHIKSLQNYSPQAVVIIAISPYKAIVQTESRMYETELTQIEKIDSGTEQD